MFKIMYNKISMTILNFTNNVPESLKYSLESRIQHFENFEKTDQENFLTHHLNFKKCIEELSCSSDANTRFLESFKIRSMEKLGIINDGKLSFKKALESLISKESSYVNDEIFKFYYDGLTEKIIHSEFMRIAEKLDMEYNHKIVCEQLFLMENKIGEFVSQSGSCCKTMKFLEATFVNKLGLLTNSELYIFETYVSNFDVAAQIILQPHIISIIGTTAFIKTFNTMSNGEFKSTLLEAVRRKMTLNYHFNKMLGLYNPVVQIKYKMFLNSYKQYSRFALVSLSSSILTVKLINNVFSKNPLQISSSKDLVGSIFDSKQGLNNDNFNILKNIAGKFAYEAGNTLGSITTSFVIGYLNKFRSGAEAVADLVDEKR